MKPMFCFDLLALGSCFSDILLNNDIVLTNTKQIVCEWLLFLKWVIPFCIGNKFPLNVFVPLCNVWKTIIRRLDLLLTLIFRIYWHVLDIKYNSNIDH